MERSGQRMVLGAVAIGLVGAVVGAILGAIFGGMDSALGVTNGIELGFLAGAFPALFVWLMLALGINQQLLGAVPGLSEEHAAAASGRLSELDVQPGETIVREGEPADRFYIVSKGQLEVLQSAANGEERRIALLSPGQFFGEIGLLHQSPRTATVRAVDRSKVLAVDARTFSNFIARAGGKATLERAAEERLGRPSPT